MQGIVNQADVEAIDTRALLPDLQRSTYDMLRRAWLRQPDAPALSFFMLASEYQNSETWSYREFFAEVTRTANLFHSLGADKNSVIAYILPNLPETHFVIWGGQAAGIVLPINPLLEPDAIAQLLNAANVTYLVTLAPFPGSDLWEKISPALGRVSSLRHVLLVNLADRVRGLKRWPARFAEMLEQGRVKRAGALALPRHVRIHDFGKSMRPQPHERLLSGRRIDPDDYSSFFCTGGTTGLPKIAMRSHRNEVANAWSVARFLGDGIGPGKNLFCGLPLFHVNGVMVTGLLPFSKGAHVIIGTPQGYRGEGVLANFWSIVEHHRIHFFSAVPTVYSTLLRVPRQGRRLDSLEYGLCGAAPMPRELFQRFQEETGLKILEGYGLTEATCVSSVNPPLGERRIGSVGLRIPGQAMKTVILDANGSYVRDAADNEVGVLTVSGPNVFAGYLHEEQNRNLWIDMGTGRRWLHTGDLAYRDAQGYFWLTGRTKELIIRGGHNIDPGTIEQPLYAHPAVQLAAAVGRPDSHAGELPVAYVQLTPGSEVGEKELLTYLESHISERAAMPKAIVTIDKMPLTAVGKIYKPELRRLEAGDALRKALIAAGVNVRSVNAAIGDDKLGLRVTVDLIDSQDEQEASQVLGLFSLSYRITVSSESPPRSLEND